MARVARQAAWGRPAIGISLIAGGLALLGWVAVDSLTPAPAPYSYRLSGETPTSETAFAEQLPGVVLNDYEVRVEGFDDALATARVAEGPDGRVLLDYVAYYGEPLLSVDVEPEPLVRLAAAIEEHTGEGALLLGWWDTGRRLNLLTGRQVLFADNLLNPVIVPAVWRGRETAVRAVEAAFWQGRSGEKEAGFDAFVEVLLSDELVGSSRLRQLAGDQEAFLVLDLRDAYKMARAMPARFGLGFKDFAGASERHGVMKQVRDWLRQEGYESYAVEPLDGNVVRVYFLTDSASQETLLARALPFSTSNPLEVDGLDLVFQHKGYWVFRIVGGGEEQALNASE